MNGGDQLDRNFMRKLAYLGGVGAPVCYVLLLVELSNGFSHHRSA